MCYESFHYCRYCNLPYKCTIESWMCPTINEDLNRNLCSSCEYELEKQLKDNFDNTDKELPDLEDLLGDE